MEVEEPIRVSPPMSPAMSPRCRVAGEAEAAPRTQSYHFRAYSYYNRTGGNDDERPINGHTAAHPATARQSELCINGFVACGRKITWGPGLRACKVPNFGEGMALLPPGIPHAAEPWR